jgi:hypothetical protein
MGAHACANQTVPYGTVLVGGAVPGTSCQATIAPSLWDESHSPIEGPRIKLALMGLKSRAESCSPFGAKTCSIANSYPGDREQLRNTLQKGRSVGPYDWR